MHMNYWDGKKMNRWWVIDISKKFKTKKEAKQFIKQILKEK